MCIRKIYLYKTQNAVKLLIPIRLLPGPGWTEIKCNTSTQIKTGVNIIEISFNIISLLIND